jgi:hypothetical protein
MTFDRIALAALAAALVVGCTAHPPDKPPSRPGAPVAAELQPGAYELWVDQRCRREARRYSHLAPDAYMKVAEEKRFSVVRLHDRIVLRSVDLGVVLEATPHRDLPGVYAIRTPSGGFLTVSDGPRGQRADLVLFGSGLPYLACDRGALRAVASL